MSKEMKTVRILAKGMPGARAFQVMGVAKAKIPLVGSRQIREASLAGDGKWRERHRVQQDLPASVLSPGRQWNASAFVHVHMCMCFCACACVSVCVGVCCKYFSPVYSLSSQSVYVSLFYKILSLRQSIHQVFYSGVLLKENVPNRMIFFFQKLLKFWLFLFRSPVSLELRF